MQISFFQRQPSAQWEPLPIARIPGFALWAWYRPQHMPGGLMVMIPPEVLAASPSGLPISMADVLVASGVPFEHLHSVSMFGADWQPGAVMAAYLGHAIPLPAPGARQEILINVSEQPLMMSAGHQQQPGMMPQPAAMPQQPVVTDFTDSDADADFGEGDNGEEIPERQKYDRVESAWRSSIQMERQMTGLRAKLSGILNTLGKLDRDLNPDERLAADREDRDAWHDARRWLRDMAAKCHREIKSFDIGMTSAAGKRNWMEETYRNVIEPRLPSSELEKIRREFESYRKDMVNLQKAMQSALQGATTNGTQRAQRVLGTISRKIRERRAKQRQPLGGTNLDRSVRRKS